MKGGELLLRESLDGHRADLVVAEGLEERLGIGAIGLVADPVAAHVLSRQEAHLVAELPDLPRPEMGRSARFEQDDCRRLLREELEQRPAAQAPAESDLPRPRRHCHLEDALCQVDGDDRSLTHGLLLSREHALMTPTTVAREMPIESGEESISSLQRTRFARC